MPKCIVCGYSSRKKTEFFRCWNEETETGCKRHTCNNCIFIIRETTGYSNYICANTFCNEEHDAERFIGLKKWFEPDKKLQYEERVKLLKDRENEVEKHLEKWEERISSATKRTVFASKKASESEKFLKHEYKQINFNFGYGNLRAEEYFYPSNDLKGSFLTSVTFATRNDLLKYKPRLKLKNNGTDLLDISLTSEQQVFTLNYPIQSANSIDAEVEFMDSSIQHEAREHNLTAILTLEFVGGN